MLVRLMRPFLSLLKREVNDEKFVNECIPEILKMVDHADYHINERIKALRCTETAFMERQKERSGYIDLTKTNPIKHMSIGIKSKWIIAHDGFENRLLKDGVVIIEENIMRNR